MKLIKSKIALTTILILTLIKGLLWAGIIPAWQAPDEQNHFSLIQFYAETNKIAVDPKYDDTASAEIIETTNLMNLDWSGQHPMWRPQFSNSEIGPNEKEIIEIPKNQREEFLFKTGGRKNPPLYYLTSAQVYKFFSPFDILVRLFALRIFSVLLGILIVLFSYLFVKSIFGEKIALTCAFIISFQPSFNFISSTVNLDVAVILVTTIFFYLATKYLQNENFEFVNILYLIFAAFLAILTKASLIPLAFLAMLMILVKEFYFKRLSLRISSMLLIVILILIWYLSTSTSFGFFKDIVFFYNNVQTGSIFGQTLDYLQVAIPHYNGEVFAWYWAVFGWLEVSLPINYYRMLRVLTILAVIGFGLEIFRLWQKRNFYQLKVYSFLIVSSFALYATTIFFDWQTYVRTGNLFGLQGRHFLAPLAVQMSFFVVGLNRFVSDSKTRISLFIIALFFVVLNFVSVYQILKYFYPAESFSQLILYISQYKPIFFKSQFLIVYTAITLALLIFTLNKFWINLSTQKS